MEQRDDVQMKRRTLVKMGMNHLIEIVVVGGPQSAVRGELPTEIKIPDIILMMKLTSTTVAFLSAPLNRGLRTADRGHSAGNQKSAYPL